MLTKISVIDFHKGEKGKINELLNNYKGVYNFLNNDNWNKISVNNLLKKLENCKNPTKKKDVIEALQHIRMSSHSVQDFEPKHFDFNLQTFKEKDVISYQDIKTVEGLKEFFNDTIKPYISKWFSTDITKTDDQWLQFYNQICKNYILYTLKNNPSNRGQMDLLFSTDNEENLTFNRFEQNFVRLMKIQFLHQINNEKKIQIREGNIQSLKKDLGLDRNKNKKIDNYYSGKIYFKPNILEFFETKELLNVHKQLCDIIYLSILNSPVVLNYLIKQYVDIALRENIELAGVSSPEEYIEKLKLFGYLGREEETKEVEFNIITEVEVENLII